MVRKSQLEAQLASANQQLSEVQAADPFLIIAQEMHQRVAEKLADVTERDKGAVMSQILASTEAGLVRQGIEDKIRSMPVPQLMGMYATILGSESVNNPLRRIAEIEYKKSERQSRLASIAYEAKVSRQLDLMNLNEGEIITVGLYRHNIDDASKAYDYEDEAGRTITARMRDQRESTLQILSDKIRKDSSYHPDYSDYRADRTLLKQHSLVQLGALVTGKEETFEPILTHGTPLSIHELSGDKTTTLHFEVGYVALGDTVLLDHPDAQE